MLIIKTHNTPEIHLSAKDCIFEIKGSSYSETADELYDKVAEWLNENLPKINCNLQCTFELDVISSLSYKKILSIFAILYKYYKKGKNIKVIWKVSIEDEENYELFEDFKELFNLPFEIFEI